MPLFGRKKIFDEDVDTDIEEIKRAVEQRVELDKGRQEPKEEPKPVEEKPAFAPLFVKIDRYRSILSSLGYIKTALVMMRNSLATLNELEKARDQTFNLIQEALSKIEKKVSSLDTELVRPAGFHEPAESAEYHDIQTVEATIADLKGQIDQLKTELEHMT